jgi:glycerol-3-phosphate dehydrogenase
MIRFVVANKKRESILAGLSVGTVITRYGSLRTSSRSLSTSTSSTACEGGVNNSGNTTSKSILPSRSEQVARLSKKEFDVLIVGGGATGSGAALDAATRGLSTALIERGDFGNETSARSTKLLWAGIRYIATASAAILRFRNFLRPLEAIEDFRSEFHMVKGAHKERRILLENNPHLTNWVPIAVPIDKWISWPPPFGHPLFAIAPLVLPAVFKFYDSLSGFSCPPSHIMGQKRAERKFPQLENEDAKYYSVFYEGQHDDSRTNTYIALSAAEEGATVTNYVEMIDTIKNDDGKVVGVIARDNLTGEEMEIHAKAIIFAGGPFTDQLRKIEDPSSKPAVAAAAGTHIVLPGYYCANGIGMLDINTSDGRFLFFLPWQGKTLVGTTDRKGPVTSLHGPPEDEIQWILDEAKKYLKTDTLQVRRSDVLSAWQGFRPLASDPNAPPGAPVSRDHVISYNEQTGVTFITGGKWTTYREMAEDVINKTISTHGLESKAGPCITDKLPLRGGVGYNRNVPIQLVQEFGVTEKTAAHLARSYGVHAFEVCRLGTSTSTRTRSKCGNLLIEGYPYLECEIEYACKYEMACTVTDFLTLRTRLAYLDSDAASIAAPKVAELMAKALGWTEEEKSTQLKEALEICNSFGGPIPSNVLETIQNTRDLFKTFDVDKSGFIDFDELKLCVKFLGFPFKNDEEAMEEFNRIDKEGNGKISEDDFVAWWNEEKNTEFRLKLDRYRMSSEKLGQGAENSGAAFG